MTPVRVSLSTFSGAERSHVFSRCKPVLLFTVKPGACRAGGLRSRVGRVKGGRLHHRGAVEVHSHAAGGPMASDPEALVGIPEIHQAAAA